MTNNSLAFIALCNEYCAAIENAGEKTKHGFIAEMLRLLPRIYISVSDLNRPEFSDGYIDSVLEEEKYDRLRTIISSIMGIDDTYLEVFEEDMKYSDTPIGSSVSENLCDLFQVFYNFIETVRDSVEEVIDESLGAMREDFEHYWGQILCNVLRPLNRIYFNGDGEDE